MNKLFTNFQHEIDICRILQSAMSPRPVGYCCACRHNCYPKKSCGMMNEFAGPPRLVSFPLSALNVPL